MRSFRLYWAPVSLQFCLILIEILQFFTKVLGTLYLLFRSIFTTCTEVHGTGEKLLFIPFPLLFLPPSTVPLRPGFESPTNRFISTVIR